MAIAVQADVTSEDDIARLIAETSLAFGGVDLVVNNAGLSISKPLLDTTAKDWDLQHDVMARGSFLVAREAARAMIAQDMGGDIVYIASKNSLFAGPNNIAYSATKADQAHQVRLLAAELGAHGIRVNGVNPDGVVRGSGIFAGGWGAQRAATYGVPEEELGAYYAQRTLLKREVLPEHVAAAVFALTGRDLSRPPACTSRSTPASPQPSCDDRASGPDRAARARVHRVVPPISRAAAVSAFAAVDLGASSGRVIVGTVDDGRVALHEVNRFPNGPVQRRRVRCTGTCSGCTAGCSTGCRPPTARPAGSAASASTRGRWTTGSSTATGPCSATRSTTATRARTACRRRSSRRSPPPSSTPARACRCSRSTPCSSWSRRRAPRRSRRPARPC